MMAIALVVGDLQRVYCRMGENGRYSAIARSGSEGSGQSMIRHI